MIEISSKTNDHFRRWADLSSARGIKKHNEFILMGEKLIGEFLENPNFKIKGEIVHEDLKSVTLTAPTLRGQRIPVFKLPKALFNEIDVVGTHYNLLVLEPKEIEPLTSASTQGLEVVSPLGDPSNLGALARSALAFGASKMILTEESCNPYHPKAIKASAGALLKLPLVKTGKFADFVASNNEEIFALDMKGENVATFKWPKNVRLAIGEEGPGFSGLKGLKRLSVHTQGVESLNATVAASIALFSYASFQK
ncbi:TrmH family RNA methyltransferase [Bdellovibrio sp. BCCA]|uniref:TrmH family RNA methyltransferase n=1 Tax=Bdellovibrio sp. BCCA TaxID=3136281 RepID=UPI0030F2F76C